MGRPVFSCWVWGSGRGDSCLEAAKISRQGGNASKKERRRNARGEKEQGLGWALSNAKHKKSRVRLQHFNERQGHVPCIHGKLRAFRERHERGQHAAGRGHPCLGGHPHSALLQPLLQAAVNARPERPIHGQGFRCSRRAPLRAGSSNSRALNLSRRDTFGTLFWNNKPLHVRAPTNPDKP